MKVGYSSGGFHNCDWSFLDVICITLIVYKVQLTWSMEWGTEESHVDMSWMPAAAWKRGTVRTNSYTEHDIQCHMEFYVNIVIFWMTLLMNKWTNIIIDDGWVHPLAKILPALVINLWWNIVMDDIYLDEKSLGK